ncbi:YdeI/OmpD-associated family protein [Paenibacillus sp. strain BS8-2]
MEIEEYIPVRTREALREWLRENGGTKAFCWVAVSMKPVPGTLLYLDAVEECLCVGWIDGVKKKISDTETIQRLSPRRKKSNWTELNKERVRRLERLGLMREEGRMVLPDMNFDSFVIDEDILRRLQEDQETYQCFTAFPSLYRRVRIDNIQSIKKQQPELFERRLDKLLAHSKENKMYGDWHDHGRLLDNETIDSEETGE